MMDNVLAGLLILVMLAWLVFLPTVGLLFVLGLVG